MQKHGKHIHHPRERICILDVEVDNLTRDELLAQLDSGFVVTPNVDHFMLLQKDPAFRAAYAQADYRLVDSQIVYLATRFLGKPVREKISGSDLLPAFYEYHRDNPEIRIFLLGAMPGVAARAAERINRKVGREIVVGQYSPPFDFEKDPDECAAIVDRINASSATVLVVGVSAPKQEIWIARYRKQLRRIRIFMALGATIDFEAGQVRRAPAWISRSGLEWLFRLVQEPGRLWRRYLQRDMLFPLLVIRQRLGRYCREQA